MIYYQFWWYIQPNVVTTTEKDQGETKRPKAPTTQNNDAFIKQEDSSLIAVVSSIVMAIARY